MLIGIGASIYSGNRYDAAISSANLAARFDANLGITASGGFASAWADQSGNGRNLLQATGANQPIHLPFAGTKYGWLPEVAGNYFSTPDSVAASIAGVIEARIKCSSPNWNYASIQTILGKGTSGIDLAYRIVLSSGSLIFQYTTDGTTNKTAVSSALVSTVFSAGQVGWIKVTYNPTTGKTNFYTSPDDATYTPLGTEQTIASGAIYDSARGITLGVQFDGTNLFPGTIYRAQIYNGIDGTLAVDFDPSRWTSGSTFTAATGETWTINSTGSKPAQIVDRASLLFDGAAHYMKTANFTLNQPISAYIVMRQITWTQNELIVDGKDLSNRAVLEQAFSGAGGVSPEVALYAGTGVVARNANLAIAAKGVVGWVLNGASSLIKINTTAEVTGNPGTHNAGGITLGAAFDGSGPSNIQVFEHLQYNVAHDAAARANIIRALMSKHGVA